MEPENGIGVLTPEALDAARRRGEPVAVLDVRRRAAWTADPTRIPGAAWVPLEEVPARARGLPTGQHLVVYCS